MEELYQPIVAEVTEESGTFQEFMGNKTKRRDSSKLPLHRVFRAAIAIDEIRTNAVVQAEELAADPEALIEQRKDEVVQILIKRAKKDK